MTSFELDLQADVIDVRDIIQRFEELESVYDSMDEDQIRAWTDLHEFTILERTLEELKSNGGDEQWRGDWYPITLIADDYFVNYAQELLEDCGDIPQDCPWYIAIDWEQTAKNIQIDYANIEIGGSCYWYR